jgi:hypothetical protein
VNKQERTVKQHTSENSENIVNKQNEKTIKNEGEQIVYLILVKPLFPTWILNKKVKQKAETTVNKQ